MSVPVWLLLRIDNELATLYCDGTKRENPAATLVSVKQVFAEKAVAEAALARLSRDFPDRQYVLLSGRAEQEITGRGNLFGRLSLERFSPGRAIDPRDISVSDLACRESQVPPATGEAWSAIVSARYREPAPVG